MKEQNNTKTGKIRLSNNMLFLLAIALILINSYTFIISSKDVVTGKAQASGVTQICISPPMSLSNPSPAAGAVTNGTYNATVIGNYVSYVDFYYSGIGIPPQLFGHDNDADGDTTFNHTLNTTALPDGNCFYRIRAEGTGYCNTTDLTASSYFTINNHDVAPTWNKFKNNISTNFSSYSSWADIFAARIGVPDAGQIEFTSTNFDGADLDFMFNISHNLIRIKTSYDYNCFNGVTYIMTFFNVTEFAEPIVLKNGQRCNSSCSSPSYDGANYRFYTTVSNENSTFKIAEGGNLSVNFTFNNKTFDNSPTVNFTTYIAGSARNLSVTATCYYKTDYDPTTFTLMNVTGGYGHVQELPEQNWSYIQTEMGHYATIQHYDYYSGIHWLYINCTKQYEDIEDKKEVFNTTFMIRPTDRDRVVYSDGDEVKLYLRLEQPYLNISVNLSEVDSGFNPAKVIVTNNSLDYNISYNISSSNTRPDGEYNVTIDAFEPSGRETMNGSIFMHLHNTWVRPDINDAFDCWNFKPGYFFDEAACNWESDVNRVAKAQVDLSFTEISCFDGIDNDGDGAIDYNDTDCPGLYYTIRRAAGIDSAFLADPCSKNICWVCLGTDNDGNGICDTSDGVNVRYLHYVKPGASIKAKYQRASIVDQSVRLSINFLDESFGVSDAGSSIVQLPRKELGGCTGGTNCKSVTATTFGPGLPDSFTGALNERITANISSSATDGPYASLAAGRSIGGSSTFQNMIYFRVNSSAIVDEGDDAGYCFDSEDNDLNDLYDCLDPSCNLTVNPANSTERCEYPHEITCNDGYDNDWDGYTDCEDEDCFQKDGTSGPCYATENFTLTTCGDSINNDFDWGFRCNSNVSVSYQTRQTDGSYSGTIQLTDCADIDCDGRVGYLPTGALCQYCNERTCNDNFDNDGDNYYDCTGNAYRNSYEIDCDRWHDMLITCPTTETNCTDNLDNDLDSISPNGEYTWLGIPVYGGWDCQDLDCAGHVGDAATGAVCQFRNETICDDGFDNDRDGLTDCDDPSTCKGLSGILAGYPGQCRPCAGTENISIDACRDTDDNDFDGSVDCSDTDCYGLPKAGVGICGLSETNCTDGIDNDHDWRTDMNDSDCSTAYYTLNELGPGQCDDNIDNDNDGGTDCGDSDCQYTLKCVTGSYDDSYCTPMDVGAITVCPTKFVVAGKNYTVRFSRNSLNASSLLFILGNSKNSLKNITSVLDSTTTFMTGTTTNFTFLRGSYGVLAENNAGFIGNLDLNFIATTDANLTPGYYDNYILTSVEGTLDDVVTPVYIAENEKPPLVTDITAEAGHRTVSPGAVNATFTVNASDEGIHNSGIAFCTMELPGHFLVNSSSCSYSTNLTSGTYNVSAVAYDGALNPSDPFSKEIPLTVWTTPVQDGNFYNSYPAENYPDKKFFNDTEKLNIGVNFMDGSGYTDNATGCVVEIMNSTHVVLTDAINLSEAAGEAHCTGQVDLSPLRALTNSTNLSQFSGGVYYFRVTVEDNAGRSGTSSIQDLNFCYYYYDNSSSKYRCMDICQRSEVLNRPPILISSIPNLTWPRATSISVIDLDDYFYDPDDDPLTYTWDIDTTRINVSVDRANIVTLNPDRSFYGFAYITFYAHDPFSSTPSNKVTLEVEYRELPPPIKIPAGGGGGGGGGAVSVPECEEDWACTDWGPCLTSGYQFRTCRDRNECGTSKNMPNTTRTCTYIPTCKDLIRNQGEEGIDCGGPCPPCPSCLDGIINQREMKALQIMSADPDDVSDCGGPFCPVCPTCEDNTQNQGEEGIDCGGPCRSCATCSDGILNQGEIGIDCGGPCERCSVRIHAQAFNWNLLLLVVSSALILLIMILALLFGVFKKKFIRLKAKLLNYYMRSVRMFEKKRLVEKELPILQWINTHLDSLEESIPSKDVNQLINEVDRLVRIFFKRVFLIRYAFTHEELTKDLEKHKIPLVLRKATDLLFDELSQIKYGGESVEKDDVKTLISQTKLIAERLVNEIETKKKTKINISERDIAKISETLSGAEKLGVKEAIDKIGKRKK